MLDKHQEASFYERLTLIEKQFPGAAVLLHKHGVMPKVSKTENLNQNIERKSRKQQQLIITKFGLHSSLFYAIVLFVGGGEGGSRWAGCRIPREEGGKCTENVKRGARSRIPKVASNERNSKIFITLHIILQSRKGKEVKQANEVGTGI